MYGRGVCRSHVERQMPVLHRSRQLDKVFWSCLQLNEKCITLSRDRVPVLSLTQCPEDSHLRVSLLFTDLVTVRK